MPKQLSHTGQGRVNPLLNNYRYILDSYSEAIVYINKQTPVSL